MILSCPLPTALTTIPTQACPFRFDQIVRAFFQRRQPSATPTFATLTAFQTLATWTPLMTAVDSTKVVASPIFSGLVIPRSEAITTGGGDNSTFNGIAEYNGEGSVRVTAQLKNVAPAVKRAMDLLSQESLSGSTGLTNLEVFMVNKDNYAFPVNPMTNAVPPVATTVYKGVPIYNFRISSAGSEGFGAPNIHDISWDMPASWADYLASVKPLFDFLTDL